MSDPISTRLLPGGARLLLDEAEIKVVSGPDRGLTTPLGLHSLVIGSSPDCDVVLHDGTVSSRHAEIVMTDRGYLLSDLGSKNGVELGTWLVDRLPLADGMKLRLGSTTLQVRRSGRSTEIELGAPRRFGPLVAHSTRMRAAAATLERLAASPMTILIEGETGTGKEVAAQAVHQASPRADGPLVVFDCGAQPPGLLASALFGHERGAFTGADEDRPGAFAEASGGTLFLDEIGELPLDLQPAFLRALDGYDVRRVGGASLRHDVRVIAATNRNLAEMVRAGEVRQDLYYRLAAARVRLPPLRERREDIPVLAALFAEEIGVTLGPELVALLSAYDWPGNVRELRHAIGRAAISPELAVVMPEAARPLLPLPEARRVANDEFERQYVERA